MRVVRADPALPHIDIVLTYLYTDEEGTMHWRGSYLQDYSPALGDMVIYQPPTYRRHVLWCVSGPDTTASDTDAS